MKSIRRKLHRIYEETYSNQELNNTKWGKKILVRDKKDSLITSQKEMAFDSPDSKSYQKVINELKARLFYIKKIMDSSVGTSAFVTLKPTRHYTTSEVIKSTEAALRLVNREFFGSNSDGRITGVVMIEIHSRCGGKIYAHAHCLLSTPDGFDCKSNLKRLRVCFEKVARTGKKKPVTDSDRASLREIITDLNTGEEFVFHYKIHDRYGRCTFPCLNVKAIYDLEWCADYMTKNIMLPEVVESDAKDEAGLYIIEYPTGVKGDKGNRPELVKV